MSRGDFIKDWDKRFVWHPFTQMKEYAGEENLIIERGEGNYLIDAEGRRYLDGVSSLWVNLHGHRKQEIDQAICDQLGKIAHSTLLGVTNEPAVRLAKRLVDIAPTGLNHVFYSDNGSTAVEVALKIAFEYWQLNGRKGKQKFVSFKDSYHGDTLGAVSVGHIELFHEIYRPLLFPAYQAPSPRDPNCLDWVEELLKTESDKIAAVIIEPLIQAAGGMIVQPPGFLEGLSALSTQHSVLLIADEVATGFGRTGTIFACEQEGVAPDLICLAKGLTGGYLPLAATLATDEVYNAFLGEYSEFKTFFHGHSYTGNPLGCAAALANLEIFEKERVIERLQPKIRTMTEGLQRFRELPQVIEVRQKGLMVGIELGNQPEVTEGVEGEAPRALPVEGATLASAGQARAPRMAHRVCLAARKKGLLVRPLGNVVVLMPPLSITEEEIHTMCHVVHEAIQ